MDLDKFDLDKLEALSAICPNQEDLEKLDNFKGNLKTLEEVGTLCIM